MWHVICHINPTPLLSVNVSVLCANECLEGAEGFRRRVSSSASRSRAEDVAKCDIDVSSGAFDDVEASSNAHNDATLGEGPLPGIAEGDSSEQHKLKELLNHSQNAGSDDLAKLAALNYPAMSTQELTVTISNLFRIYPLNNIQAESTSGANFLQVTMADWHDEVIKLAVKAQAYTATAVRSISSPKSDDTLMLWFGSTSTSSKKEVRRVLNQVNHLLSNVEYIYPGPQCRENVFAYVHPKPPHNKNGKGQYLFYLCDESRLTAAGFVSPIGSQKGRPVAFFGGVQEYVNADSSTKLETLSHEASHHEMSLTDDVCTSLFLAGFCAVLFGLFFWFSSFLPGGGGVHKTASFTILLAFLDQTKSRGATKAPGTTVRRPTAEWPASAWRRPPRRRL